MRAAPAVLGLCLVLAAPTAVSPTSTTADLGYLVGLSAVVLALWAGAWRCPPGARRTWAWVALAATCWLVGDVLQRTVQQRADNVVGPADLFWLASYPLLATAVLRMIRARSLDRGSVRELFLDVSAVTAVAACLAWQLLIAHVPAVRRGWRQRLRLVALPLGDVTLFGLAVTVLIAPGVRTVSGRLLASCLAATLVLDALLAVLPTLAPSFQAARLDAALLVVNGLLAAAAVHPSAQELALPTRTPVRLRSLNRWRILMLGAALTALSVVTQLSPVDQRGDRVVMVVAGALLSVTVVLRFYGVVRDREQAEDLLRHQATHDPLTGLANRGLLSARLEQEVSRAAARRHGFAVLYLDLDGFKQVNDTWGHHAGDHVLRTVGERLCEITRAHDTVSRFGGDEFVVLCSDVEQEVADRLSGRIRAEVGSPITWMQAELRVAASLGAYWVDPDGLFDPSAWPDVEDILRASDQAMYSAKSQGIGVVRVAAGSGRPGGIATGGSGTMVG